MKKTFLFIFLVICAFATRAQPIVIPNVWINEIHYDDVGTDTLEGFEIAGPAGSDLSCYRVFLYTATGNILYSTINLFGLIPDLGCGFGTVWFPKTGIQNGPADAIALEYAPTALNCGLSNQDTILQFISYEGVMTASNGRAAGLTSIDIGVAEGASTHDSTSMQLTGFGTAYNSFTWVTGLGRTPDQINRNQSFCPPPPTLEFYFSAESISENSGTYNVEVIITNPNTNPISATVNIAGGTATLGSDYNFSPNAITFPANSTVSQFISFTPVNDNLNEGNETIFITLSNLTNGAVLGTNSTDTLTILDDDFLNLSIYPPTQSQYENIGTINVPVLLNKQSVNPTSVTVKLISSTATQGQDFFFTDTTITWPAGTSGTIQVPVQIVDDNLYELDETISLKITSPTNGASMTDSTFLITILNNDNLTGSDCSDLFFSEYIEGSGNNKALEIYNPTSSAINLADYRILRFNNGATAAVTHQLNGVIASNGVRVLVNPQSDSLLRMKADTLTGFINHNGNDAYALVHLTDTIDVIGQIGVDPGNSWVVDTGSTADHTLIRNFYTYIGTKNWNNAAESWKAYPNNMIDSIGFHHTAPCGSPEPISPAIVRFVRVYDSVPEIYTPTFNYFKVVVQCINPSGQPANFVVAFDPALSTATAGLNNDFTFTNTAISNGPGTTYDTVSFIINNDNLIEPTENALLRFINLSSNVQIGSDSIYNLYITDSDVLTVSFLGAGYLFPEDAGVVQVPVVLSTPTPDSTSVMVKLAAGSATRNQDFTFNDTTLTFSANSDDTLAFLIRILEDNIDEGNEEINFDLINPTNGAILGLNGCTVTIIDNEIIGIPTEIGKSDINLYPNPVRHELFVKADAHALFSITDILGQVIIQQQEIMSGLTKIDVSNLSAGMYLLNINRNDEVISLRIVKQD